MSSSAEPSTIGLPVSKWGLRNEELAEHPTVFRDGLLEGKCVLISGGGSGLGKAMAFLMARLGARVMICGRNESKLVEASEAIQNLVGSSVSWQSMSIRDHEAVDQLIATSREQMGGLDILVNNAGGQFPQDAIDFSVKGWHAVIDTNLNGTWYMMQSAARHWRDNGEPGSIVNIVATVWKGMPQVAHTCAARAGVIYLSKTLATEWAPLDIRVNCVAPGAVETEGFDVYPKGVPETFADSNPMRRLGDAFDIAEASVYLTAPSGKFITGEVLVVDGGHQQWGTVWPNGRPDYFKVD
ncbi:MAG TPA: SDR family oxidoreductase [Xanthomonadales bacterium]|nr:SDR family oxidoreductase [Xanthomonadales bacterium]